MVTIIEIQQASDERTLAQLCAIASQSETLCSIIAFSPQTVVGPLYWGAMLNVLIVQDQHWYLLRDAHRQLLVDLLPVVMTHTRSFFVRNKITSLAAMPLQDAAEYVVNVQPCLLSAHTVEWLKLVAMPNHGEAIRLAEAIVNR